MTLVAHSGHPAFETMRTEGVPVVDGDEAAANGLPDLSVGLLNLMPDAALRAADRQFIRLVAAGAGTANLWVYPFTVAAGHRGAEARGHIDAHYVEFADLRASGLDALIVTGANPAQPDLEREYFWTELAEVLDWASDHVHSVLCSCLATHVVVQRDLGVERVRLPQKRWGLYSHRLLRDHPLLEGLSSPVDAPHSHWYDVTRDQLESVGVTVLAESDEAGVHMAVDADDFYVFFQGHPEYEPVSLLKEYKREIGRFFADERPDLPPLPEHYFSDSALAAIDDHRRATVAAKETGGDLPILSEQPLLAERHSTWTDAGRTVYRNWLRRVAERKKA